MENLQSFRSLSYHLQLDRTALHIGKAPLRQHFSGLHNPHMVADVFQLPQIVGGNQNRCLPAGHIIQNQAPHLPPHDGIQTVHRLVQNQHLGAGGQGKVEGRLLLHTLAEAPDGALSGQSEHILKLPEPFFIEMGIDAGIIGLHIQKAGPGKVEGLVCHTADFFLCQEVFINGLPLQGDGSAVRPINTGQVPDGGGFARAVGSDQAVDSAPGYL